MSSMYARMLCFVGCLVAAVLFQLTQTPSITVAFFTEIFVFAVVGLLVGEIVFLLQKLLSPLFILKSLLSLVVGFGSATFIVVCSQVLFGQHTFPLIVDPIFRFILPLSMTFVAFSSLHVLLMNKASGILTEDSGLHSDEACLRTYIPDVSALEDGRIVDLARIGMFDNQFVLPSFLVSELKFLSETGEETARLRAKKAYDAVRRLEALPKINIQTSDFHITDELDLNEKIVAAAKMSKSLVMTNEVVPLRPDAELYFAIDSIANALRPPIPKGEMLSIKIQRLGKEPKQGIGYLDDGTMVVVNGGGDFLGRTVRTQVLSQKYSSSGKIVFCNVREDGYDERLGAYVVPYPQVETIGHYIP